MDHSLNKKGNGLALVPFLVFVLIYLGAGLILQSQGVEMAFYQFPSVTAMFIALLVAFAMTKGTINERFRVFAKGAANEDVLTMLIIYLLAGAFSSVAASMGGRDATVNLGLSLIPVQFLTAGVFIISAFMGTATGTSMGTIGAIVPIAVGVADKGGLSVPLVVGSSVGLPSIWVLAAVTLGGKLLGVGGMLLFIPLCSVLYALFRDYVKGRLREKEVPAEKWRDGPHS